MELSILLLKQIIVMLLMILMGYLLVKQGILRSEDHKVLSVLNVDWVMPCCIIGAFLTDFEQEKLVGLGIACLGCVVVYVVFFLFLGLFRRHMKLSVVEEMSALYSNAGNLIIPLVSALLGDEAIFYCSAFMAIQNLVIFSHGYWKMTGSMNLKEFFNRNIIATFIGLALFLLQIPLPDIVVSGVKTIGSVIGPLCMFMTGMIMGGMKMRDILSNRRYYMTDLLRLIVMPLLVVLVFRISGMVRLAPIAGEVLLVTMLATCSPPASLVTQLTSIYRSYPEIEDASCINILGILASVLTMPLIILIYQVICL